MKRRRKKRTDLLSESLLVRANNLTVPPSHAAKALASPKREAGISAATHEPKKQYSFFRFA